MLALLSIKEIYFAIMFAVTILCGLLPIKLLELLKTRTKSLNTLEVALSLMSCFSGGVFFGVCLLDMLPDALEAFNYSVDKQRIGPDLPIVPMIIGAGFFFIYLFDQLIATFTNGGHGHSHELISPSPRPTSSSAKLDAEVAENTDTISLRTSASVDTFVAVPVEGRLAYIKSLTFIFAFLLHVSLEGFALGVQKDAVDVLNLFIGIILHKGIAAFSIGTRLHHNHPRNTPFVVGMLVLVATVTTIGGVIGMMIEEATMDSTDKALVEMSLTSVSIGTFLYITFFEILGSEKGSLGQRVAALFGFLLIGATVIFVRE